MKLKKTDWSLVKETESKGFVVGMTSLVEKNRTKLNDEVNHPH